MAKALDGNDLADGRHRPRGEDGRQTEGLDHRRAHDRRQRRRRYQRIEVAAVGGPAVVRRERAGGV